MSARCGEKRSSPRQPVTGAWRYVFCALLIVCCTVRSAAAAEADPDASQAGIVRVTAGEHGDFSRIVFAIGANPRYRTDARPDGLRLEFPGASFEFDFSVVSIETRTAA
jgi:hypothetical protein